MSALVCPGVGQFMQRRPATGLFFLVAFLGAIILFFTTMLGPMIANLQAAVEIADGGSGTLEKPPILRALGYFGLTLLVYALNIISTWRTHTQQMTAWREAEMMRVMEYDPANGPPPLPEKK